MPMKRMPRASHLGREVGSGAVEEMEAAAMVAEANVRDVRRALVVCWRYDVRWS